VVAVGSARRRCGRPIVRAVWAFTADVSDLDGLGGIVVFLWQGPMVVVAVAVVTWIAVWTLVERCPDR
jgi:hypothetical protein